DSLLKYTNTLVRILHFLIKAAAENKLEEYGVRHVYLATGSEDDNEPPRNLSRLLRIRDHVDIIRALTDGGNFDGFQVQHEKASLCKTINSLLVSLMRTPYVPEYGHPILIGLMHLGVYK